MNSTVTEAKIATLIEVETTIGTGEEDDPYRRIKQWFHLTGELVVELDLWKEEKRNEAPHE